MPIAVPQAPRRAPVRPVDPLHLEKVGLGPRFLDSFPKEFFDTQAQARADKDKRAARIHKVMACRPLDEAGHSKVNDAYRWFEGCTRTNMETWAGLVAGAICPPRTDWMEMEADHRDDHSQRIAEAMKEIVWRMLMEGGHRFPDMLKQWIHDSGAEFGNVVMPSLERYYNFTARQWDQRPVFDVYRQDDYVLDASAKDWRKSALGLRIQYCKRDLLDLARPYDGPHGRRAPVFDMDRVQQIIAQGGGDDENTQELAQVKAELRAEQNDGEWFTGYQYIGYVKHEEADRAGVDYPVIITSVNGVRVQAIPKPRDYRTWVLMGGANGLAGDVYPECKAEFLAMLETKINLGKTMSTYLRSMKTAGVWTYKTDKPALVKKHGRRFNPGPGAVVPDIFEQMKITGDLSDVENERLQLLKMAQEYIGVSEAAKAGLPAPGTTATAAMGAQQGGATRNSQDAEHYTGAVVELLTILVHLICEEVAEKQFITADDGELIEVRPEDLRAFKGSVRINSLGTSSLAPWQQQTVFTALQNWSTIPGYDPIEGGKLVGNVLGLSEHMYRQVVKPVQPAPMAPPPPGAAPPGDVVAAEPVSQAMQAAPGPEGAAQAMGEAAPV